MDYRVIKRDHHGNDVLEYAGMIREKTATMVCVDAYFAFKDRDLGYVIFRKGDLFTETFYSDRWYNIFRVQDVHTEELKGWYCNITRPADIHEDYVAADDLALDVFVYPDGRTLLLDEDEFSSLNIPDADRASARRAVDEINHLVATCKFPFNEIGGNA